MGRIPPHPPHTPGVFVRVANKGVAGYGTWKSVRKIGGTGIGESARYSVTCKSDTGEVDGRQLKAERKEGFNAEITESAECGP